jgi:hypothetical protein
VDAQVSRAAIVTGSAAPKPVAAGPVDIHTTVPSGATGRVLRLADSAAAGWTATLDGKPLTRTTVDGWAQGFELPASGGRLDVTYDDPIGHTAWLWTQGALALVLVVLALPGRRREIDDDLPEEELIPAQAVAGEGRRARRLRAQAEAEAVDQTDDPADTGQFDAFATNTPPPPAEEAATAIPQQQSYGEWDTASYAGAEYGTYGGEQYQANEQYQAGTYDQSYQADPYQGGQYDPYAYGGQPPTPAYDPTYEQGYDQNQGQNQGYDPNYDPAYDPTYDPAQQHPHGSERPDGSQQ